MNDFQKREVRVWPADDGSTDWVVAVNDRGRYWTWHRVSSETAEAMSEALAPIRARREGAQT